MEPLTSKPIEDRLIELGIKLPVPSNPSGTYNLYVLDPPFIYISGTTPKIDGVLQYKGKVGKDLSEEYARLAARQCAMNLLGILKMALGSLDHVDRIIKLVGFINVEEDFYHLPSILNGASNLFVEIFGEKGRHARSAIGISCLPGNAPIEIEMIAKIKS